MRNENLAASQRDAREFETKDGIMKIETRRSFAPVLAMALLLASGIGCEVPEIDDEAVEGTSAPVAVAEVDGPTEGGNAISEVKEGYLPDGRLDMSGVKGEPPMTTSTPREVTAKDPVQGKRSRRVGGYLGSTVDKIPWAKNQTIFLMIKSNLEIYNAIKGDYPKTHEEFMEDYLPEFYPAALPLPELEPGDEYIYDPEDHTLKIWRPSPDEPREFTAKDPKKGKKSRSVGGYAGAVFGARFWAEHQMILNKMKHDLDIYNGLHGYYPKSHEEFMNEFLDFSGTKLPELDPGVEYLYDPEDHTLKVQKLE